MIKSRTLTFYGPCTVTIGGELYDVAGPIAAKVAAKSMQRLTLRLGCLDLSGRLMFMEIPLVLTPAEQRRIEIAIVADDEIWIHFPNLPQGNRDIRIAQPGMGVSTTENRVRFGIKSELVASKGG